jgi:glycosyltransferase involved in cell wall biosynthesis
MKVLICNERLLFRFGLDRVLILLAKGLKERGHEIYMMSAQWDEAVVAPLAKRFIPVEGPADYSKFNEHVADWLRLRWDDLFTPYDRPDVVLIGGWPFFAAIDVLAEVCPAVVFVEPGAVPLEGFDAGGLAIQKILRRHRKASLPKATAAFPISQFLADSQTILDGVDHIQTILLGADHMEQVLWQTQLLAQNKPSRRQRLKTWLKTQIKPPPPSSVAQVDRLLSAGKRLILNLGRWESNCYKNSESCIELARSLQGDYPEAVILTLAEPNTLEIPQDVRANLVAIGFPDDAELQAIMKKVSLGISVSLWEGFNLPLAEMQWIEQPALVYDLGAHPEVVVHPWFLCADQSEMLGKIKLVLGGSVPLDPCEPARYEQWRSFFNWQRVVDEYEVALQALVDGAEAKRRRMGRAAPLLIVDVTNSCRDPANSGVVRVTRQLSRMLQKRLDPLFVMWDFESQQYVMPGGMGYHCLKQFNGPNVPEIAQTYLSLGEVPPTLDQFLATHPEINQRPKVFLFAETILDPRCNAALNYVKSRHWETAGILYDLIPMLYPEYCGKDVKACFVSYLAMMARLDQTIGISEYSAQCFRDYCSKNGITSGKVTAVMLPGEFGQQRRNKRIGAVTAQLKLLCVSTLEPRKNHRSLLQACQILSERHPDIAWELTLVGNRYEGAPEIYRAVEALAAQDDRVQWLGVVDDQTLHQLYNQASLTVYSSLVEGFGMPILESIWHGRPCLCHHQGVMAELAAQTPGCLAVDMADPEAIATQLAQLAQNQGLLQNLTQAACHSSLKTWHHYIDEVFQLLDLQEVRPLLPHLPEELEDWQNRLYPNGSKAIWHTYPPRRALAELLCLQKPSCAIALGTVCESPLSLIAQHAEMAFSIGIDPAVQSQFMSAPENISLLIGQPTVVFPQLIDTLAQAGVTVDLIVINGAQSAADLGRDINLVLAYVPEKTTFIVIHDVLTPDCREEIRLAPWGDCAYTKWVDLDFIAASDQNRDDRDRMQGGLTLAILSPNPRCGELIILESAQPALAVQTRT